MQHKRYTLVAFITGCFLIILGSTLLFLPQHALAQDDEEEREYVGAGACTSCHSDIARLHDETPHARTLFDPDRDEEYLLADFAIGEAERTVQFPDEDEPRPFTLDDVEYAVGSGRYVQRFLYEIDRNEFQVLPVEWNVLEERWQPFTLGEEWPSESYDWATNCAYCHVTDLNVSRGRWEDDGVQCETCHGPGSVHEEVADRVDDPPSSRERAQLEASIEMGLDAQSCGQCHSRGFEPADNYPFPQDYIPGMNLLSEDVFVLYPQDDPVHWWETGHAAMPNMQFNEWVESGHAGAFEAIQGHQRFRAGCLSCHNADYGRAENILLSIETNDDRERLAILYEEAGIEIEGLEDLPWEEVRTQTIEILEIDPALIDVNAPFLPQILPNLLERMHASGALAEGSIIPQSMATTMALGQGTAEADNGATGLGVTCATCHYPHTTEETEFQLVSDSYDLCISCHQNGQPITGRLHYPTREMFEGITVVENVPGIPSAHFTTEGGPTCVTCHMEAIPVEGFTRASHTMNPLLPSMTMNAPQLTDGCSSCHEEAADPETLAQLISDIQQDTEERLSLAQDTVNDNTPEWVSTSLNLVEGDGSLGVHNYAYTDALLDAVFTELGLFDVGP